MILDKEIEAMGRDQARMCAENPPVFLELLVTAVSQRSVMCFVYYSLVAQKKLLPIEQAPMELKRNLWEMAKTDARGRLEPDKLRRLAIAYYTLAYFLNQ